MEPVTLQLFQDKKQLVVTEDQIITPLVEVLDTITPKTNNKSSSSQETAKTLRKSLDELFPEQEYEEKQIKRTKEVLGSAGEQLAEAQIRDIASEVKFLTSTWLDDFERSIFEGLTLQEMLHEKGGT